MMVAGDGISQSGNSAPATNNVTRIATPDDLAEALRSIADEAERRSERGSLVAAIRWAADAAPMDEDDVDVRASARVVREMAGASEWVKTALSSLIEGATGAIVGHWLLEIFPTT
jgi:hypothetical protein